MLEFISGFRLDDFHLLCELTGEDEDVGWYVVTFYDPIQEDGTVDCNTRNSNGELFSMVQIDPNNFEWNGRSVRFEIDKA